MSGPVRGDFFWTHTVERPSTSLTTAP